jgi:hypothetical protein
MTKRTYCTLSDKSYLIQGLALFESLKDKSTEDFALYYLCLDDEAFSVINSLEDERIVAVPMSELESKDFEIFKKNTEYPSYLGQTIEEEVPSATFPCCLSAYFTEYMVGKLNPQEVLYIDSDIVFLQDPKLVFDEIGDRSIGIHLNRLPSAEDDGMYNVGIVYFKNNKVGYRCLKWWRDCVMDKTNKWMEPYGRAMDQAYLEGFEPLFGKENVSVIDDNIGHGAPWNVTLYEYDGEEINWYGNRQKMVFFHFSNFCPDFENNSYEAKECFLDPRVRQYYDDYFDSLKTVRKKYDLLHIERCGVRPEGVFLEEKALGESIDKEGVPSLSDLSMLESVFRDKSRKLEEILKKRK